MTFQADQDGNGNGPSGSVAHFRTSPDALYSRMADQAVLVDMRTNRIYDLNRTSAHIWELLSAGHDQTELQRILAEHYDVPESRLTREVEEFLAQLERAQLIRPAPGD